MPPMPERIRRRFERFARGRLTWDPVAGGKPPLLTWRDEKRHDLGQDEDGECYREIAGRMLSGRYYPEDVMDCFGLWLDENRPIRAGDRNLQRARMVPWLKWPVLWAMTEFFVAEDDGRRCTLGYVTTEHHFGKGIWKATLERIDNVLTLTVTGLSGPNSWPFWLGLPIARFLQKRAWRRAPQEFARLCRARAKVPCNVKS